MGEEFNSPAAAFAQKGKGNYSDVEVADSPADSNELSEVANEIKAAARTGDYGTARLQAAQIVGDAEDDVVDDAREQIDEELGGVDYEASCNTLVAHAAGMADAAADGNEVEMVRIAMQIVEAVNNSEGL